MGELCKIVVDTHHVYHGLAPVIVGQGLVGDTLGGHQHLGHGFDGGEGGVVGRGRLATGGHHLYLWVEIGEERRHQVVKAVKHAEHDDQCHGGYGHAHHRDA